MQNVPSLQEGLWFEGEGPGLDFQVATSCVSLLPLHLHP